MFIGRDISPENAMDYIFGYSIGNDVTARDIQKSHGGQFFKGKTLDKSCPLGPYIVPRMFLNDHDVKNSNISLLLNKTLMQDSNTSKMMFSIEQIISSLSTGFTLKPGDIILTGTPDGVGYARNPPITLKTGDSIAVTIENIGIFNNGVL